MLVFSSWSQLQGGVIGMSSNSSFSHTGNRGLMCNKLCAPRYVCVQVTDEVAGVIRWKRYLDFLIFSFFKQDVRDYDRMEPLLRQVLCLSLFRMGESNGFSCYASDASLPFNC
jgi:hypothetical protein